MATYIWVKLPFKDNGFMNECGFQDLSEQIWEIFFMDMTAASQA
jgi:predicted lactoylglutathione lyase